MILKKIKKVETIPSLPELGKNTNLIQRVAVYARVSTDHEEQQTSLTAQMDYYAKLIDAHADWNLAGIYADDGVTGTSYLQRHEFQRMMQDCENGQIDRIITKSVSRFARNTVDALNAIRKLKELGIGVYFEKENIWTLDSKGEFLITLMTSLAQEESRSISENVTWGHRKRFADGRYSCAYSRFLGYDYDYAVNDEEAVTVRLIYKMFLQGFTAHTIGLRLTELGIPTPGGVEVWSQSTVRSILTNERYKGDALLQKNFTTDFLGHKTKKNEGEVNQYYVENGHEAIIAPWLFDYVQEKLKERLEFDNRYSGVSYYSSKFICGRCGATFGLKPKHASKKQSKYRKDVWMCRNRFKKGMYCKNIRIDNADIDALTCKIAVAAIKKKRHVLDLCKSLLNECGVEGLDSIVNEFARFTYSAIEDMSMIINRLEVQPDGRTDISILNGTRHKLAIGIAPPKVIERFSIEQCQNDAGEFLCKQCGKVVIQTKGRKQKLFCSDECRQSWHKIDKDKKGTHTAICKHCGKAFMYYKGDRKYCSRECYIAERFWKINTNYNKQQQT